MSAKPDRQGAGATPKAAAGKQRLSSAAGAYRRTSSGPLPAAGVRASLDGGGCGSLWPGWLRSCGGGIRIWIRFRGVWAGLGIWSWTDLHFVSFVLLRCSQVAAAESHPVLLGSFTLRRKCSCRSVVSTVPFWLVMLCHSAIGLANPFQIFGWRVERFACVGANSVTYLQSNCTISKLLLCVSLG